MNSRVLPYLERPPIPERGCVGDDFSREWAGGLRVLLNGIEQVNVVAFDCDAGQLIRLKLGPDGKPFVDWQNGRVAQELVRGKVEVEWK